jgi:oligopeptide/dipeptide ABC transporter ATP-binding protein
VGIVSGYFEIENLNVGFKTFEGEKNVLDIDSLVLDKGETFGIVGESGAGKTVLALTILRLLSTPPAVIRSGSINFNGENLLQKTEKEMRRIRGRKISMIFQDPMSTLNPVFTVGEQIVRVFMNNKKLSRKEAAKEALSMIDMVKLPDAGNIMGKYPHELSGGQRQRIVIAIALSCGAEFLIADEPTRNLDVTIQAGILKLVAELQRELGVTVLFIANNLGLVSVICNRVAILHEGRIIETGKAREVLRGSRHPYTHTLLNAVPGGSVERVLPGVLMPGGEKGTSGEGCRYYSRCPERQDICRARVPDPGAISGTHTVACHRAFKGGEAGAKEYSGS